MSKNLLKITFHNPLTVCHSPNSADLVPVLSSLKSCVEGHSFWWSWWYSRVWQRLYKRFLRRLFLEVSRSFLNDSSAMLRGMGIILQVINNSFSWRNFLLLFDNIHQTFWAPRKNGTFNIFAFCVSQANCCLPSKYSLWLNIFEKYLCMYGSCCCRPMRYETFFSFWNDVVLNEWMNECCRATYSYAYHLTNMF